MSNSSDDLDKFAFENKSSENTSEDGDDFNDFRESAEYESEKENLEDYEYKSIDGIDPDDQPQLILRCLVKRDINGLKRLAINGGLVNDDLRKMVWPRLAKVHIVETSPRPDALTIESHPFYNQVLLDVNRSLKRFPPSIQEHHRLSMQDQLVKLIMRVLIKNPSLCYYQGYHDICVTFLLVLGEEMAFYVVNKISITHLSLFMEKTMDSTCDLLTIVENLIKLEHQQLGEHLEQAEVGNIYSLSWIITWFSHVLKNYNDVGRLFDLFLSSHPWMPIYLSVSMVLDKQDQLLALPCDMPTLHRFLTNIPENDDLLFEPLISKAIHLFEKHPPENLKVFMDQAKRKRLKEIRSKQSLVKRIFNFGISSFFSIKFMSITIMIVVFASFIQYFNIYKR